MRFKKVILIVLSTSLLIGISLFSYRYYLLNKTSHLAKFIPSEAKTVVYFNTRVFYQNFPKTGKGDISFLKNNRYFKNIKNPLGIGIDFTSDAAYVELENTQYVLVLISDLENFENTLQEIGPNIFSPSKKGKIFSSAVSLIDSFQLVWSDKALALIPKQYANIDLEKIFNTELNFANTKEFKQVKNDSAYFWFYTKKSKFEPIKHKTIKGIGNFKNGLEIFATENIEAEVKKEIPEIKQDKDYSIFSADKDETFINKYLKEISILLLGAADDNIMTVNFNRSYKSLFIGGNKRVEQKSISYSYDNNFNVTQVIKSSYDTIRLAKLDYKYVDQINRFQISNADSNDSLNLPNTPEEYNAYLNFNQSALEEYFPSPLQYQVIYIHSKTSKNIEYYLKINSSNWKTFLKSKLF
jgi:hypothetical protein